MCACVPCYPPIRLLLLLSIFNYSSNTSVQQQLFFNHISITHIKREVAPYHLSPSHLARSKPPSVTPHPREGSPPHDLLSCHLPPRSCPRHVIPPQARVCFRSPGQLPLPRGAGHHTVLKVPQAFMGRCPNSRSILFPLESERRSAPPPHETPSLQHTPHGERGPSAALYVASPSPLQSCPACVPIRG